jgi:hypothetical protein
MSSKKMYYIMVGVIGLMFVGLIAGALGTNAVFEKQSKKLVDAKLQSNVLSQQQVSLVQAKKDIAKYAPLEQIAKSVVPQDKDQAEAVREIVNLANQNGIKLSSITFPASTLGTTAPSASAGSTTTTTPAPSTSTPNLSQLQPFKGIKGVYDLQITVQSDTNHPVPYASFLNFLTALENNRRTAEVSSIALHPEPNNHASLSFTLTLNEYIKP